MDDTVPTSWQNFVEVVTHPFTLLQSLVEYMMAWFFTRRWKALLPFLPAMLLIAGVVGVVGYGWFLNTETLLVRYSVWAEEAVAQANPTGVAGAAAETPASPASDESQPATGTEATNDEADASPRPRNAVMDIETVSPLAEMLLRRMLFLDRSNIRANYLVAAQMGRQGRAGQARFMMRKIAPVDARGFPPGHAWLAVDRITRLGAESNEDLDELLHDLELAATWNGAGPALLAIYADLLERVGKVGEAISVLTEAVKMQPDLQVKLANMAYRNNRKQPLERASSDAKKRIEAKLEDGTAEASDYASLANLYLLDQEPEKAFDIASKGLRLEPESPALKRLVSEAYRMKYLLSRRSSESGTQVNLGLLDAALKADPSNPAVSQEVASLIAMGKEAPPELKQALETQLLEGQATAVTHLMMAIADLKENKLAEAIVRLELALRQAPNAPIVLNNLALALARTRPEQLPRSVELIDRAVRLDPNSAEYRDTQAEIRMLADDLTGAIESYEEAVRLDPERVSAREKLADAYEKIGLPELADAQRSKAKELRAQQ